MVNQRLEKYAIYSKDFKGLPDGWHNLRRCNFLVGENSTGKSSFLQLIELMESRAHMVFLDFLGTVEGIDTVSDVCSRISGAKETTIGFLIKEHPDDEGNSKIKGRLITYKAVNDNFIITKLTAIQDNAALRLKRQSKKISYRSDVFQYDPELLHTQNGRKLEELHLNTSDRFRGASRGRVGSSTR